jgi:hypothetical protein
LPLPDFSIAVVAWREARNSIGRFAPSRRSDPETIVAANIWMSCTSSGSRPTKSTLATSTNSLAGARTLSASLAAVEVADRAREVAAGIEDLRVGGAQHRLAHLLDDGVQPVLDHRGDDGIEGHGRLAGGQGGSDHLWTTLRQVLSEENLATTTGRVEQKRDQRLPLPPHYPADVV